MAGCRPLTRPEERRLLIVVRRLPPRDRALITTQWFSALRISATMGLTVGQVWRHNSLVEEIAIPPRNLKGRRGRTQRVPMTRELARALTHQLWWLRLKYKFTPELPLFPSRQAGPGGEVRPLTRIQAHTIIKHAFAAAGILDDGRLGSHCLRKTAAAKAWAHCKDPLVLRDLLGHADLRTSQLYLDSNEGAVRAALLAGDFTRRPRSTKPASAIVLSVENNLHLFPTAPAPANAAPVSCAVY